MCVRTRRVECVIARWIVFHFILFGCGHFCSKNLLTKREKKFLIQFHPLSIQTRTHWIRISEFYWNNWLYDKGERYTRSVNHNIWSVWSKNSLLGLLFTPFVDNVDIDLDDVVTSDDSDDDDDDDDDNADNRNNKSLLSFGLHVPVSYRLYVYNLSAPTLTHIWLFFVSFLSISLFLFISVP